jgi:hypothetical protein
MGIARQGTYAGLGVTSCWLFDPILQTLETYQLYQGHWSLQDSLKDDDPLCADPSAGLTISLSHL